MRQVGDRFDVAGKSMMLNDASLDDVDPEISELIAQEKHRQVRGLSTWSALACLKQTCGAGTGL